MSIQDAFWAGKQGKKELHGNSSGHGIVPETMRIGLMDLARPSVMAKQRAQPRRSHRAATLAPFQRNEQSG